MTVDNSTPRFAGAGLSHRLGFPRTARSSYPPREAGRPGNGVARREQLDQLWSKERVEPWNARRFAGLVLLAPMLTASRVGAYATHRRSARRATRRAGRAQRPRQGPQPSNTCCPTEVARWTEREGDLFLLLSLVERTAVLEVLTQLDRQGWHAGNDLREWYSEGLFADGMLVPRFPGCVLVQCSSAATGLNQEEDESPIRLRTS